MLLPSRLAGLDIQACVMQMDTALSLNSTGIFTAAHLLCKRDCHELLLLPGRLDGPDVQACFIAGHLLCKADCHELLVLPGRLAVLTFPDMCPAVNLTAAHLALSGAKHANGLLSAALSSFLLTGAFTAPFPGPFGPCAEQKNTVLTPHSCAHSKVNIPVSGMQQTFT